jgi:hypothetical protein
MSGLVVLVTGGRDFADESLLFPTLDEIHEDTQILALIHGGCHERGKTDLCGADGLADKWAKARGVPVEDYPVSDEEWEHKGRRAGPERNGFMVGRLATLAGSLGAEKLCVAFPGGRGTADCKRQAKAARVRVVKVVATKEE